MDVFTMQMGFFGGFGAKTKATTAEPFPSLQQDIEERDLVDILSIFLRITDEFGT